MCWDDKNLYLGAIIDDETHLPNKAVSSLWNGDSLQIGISVNPQNMIKPNNDGIQETAYCEIGVSPLNQKENSWVWASMNRSLMELHKPVPELKSNTNNENRKTEYKIAIPWETLNIKYPKKCHQRSAANLNHTARIYFSVNRITNETGFGSALYLQRVFKRYTVSQSGNTGRSI